MESIKIDLQWQKKKGFFLNPTRAGSILALSNEVNSNFNLTMSYSLPDMRTNIIENKVLKLSRESRADGIINLELNCASESANTSQKIEIGHSDFIVIQRLIDVT